MWAVIVDDARARQTPVWTRGLFALLLVALFHTTGGGQLPGAPVLQNAWAAPGGVAAVDYGGDSDGSVYAGAAAWAPASARFQLSGGVGLRSRTNANTKVVYGVRAAMPLGTVIYGVGLGVFAGIGGGGAQTKTLIDSTTSRLEIPVGIALGWRRALAGGRGISIYASPSYTYFAASSDNGGLVRAGIGLDLGVTNSIGITGGIEFGQTREFGLGGPTGAVYGAGISYAFGRR